MCVGWGGLCLLLSQISHASLHLHNLQLRVNIKAVNSKAALLATKMGRRRNGWCEGTGGWGMGEESFLFTSKGFHLPILWAE